MHTHTHALLFQARFGVAPLALGGLNTQLPLSALDTFKHQQLPRRGGPLVLNKWAPLLGFDQGSLLREP